jgi:hypothetical protein
MNNEQLDKFKAWFDKFVAGFYGNDDFVNANIKMKEDHSRRVCEEMLYLADELRLAENQRALAETIGLLHDVGRFPQFIKYRTYNDPRSINHCLLGLEVLQKETVLAPLPENERQLIDKAIQYHGDKELPKDLGGETLLLSKMIRDADKLDIYNVVTRAYIQHRDDPDNFKLEIEFPDVPEYTPVILEAVLTGRLIDYKLLRTWNDMKLCILGWVYDIYFPAALKRIKQRRYLETIFGFLPDNDDTAKVRQKIFAYVDGRIKSSRK